MRSDRASDLGWTREVHEAMRRPNVGPLSSRRTWRDAARVGMMRATVWAGVLAAVAAGLLMAGILR